MNKYKDWRQSQRSDETAWRTCPNVCWLIAMFVGHDLSSIIRPLRYYVEQEFVLVENGLASFMSFYLADVTPWQSELHERYRSLIARAARVFELLSDYQGEKDTGYFVVTLHGFIAQVEADWNYISREGSAKRVILPESLRFYVPDWPWSGEKEAK